MPTDSLAKGVHLSVECNTASIFFDIFVAIWFKHICLALSVDIHIYIQSKYRYHYKLWDMNERYMLIEFFSLKIEVLMNCLCDLREFMCATKATFIFCIKWNMTTRRICGRPSQLGEVDRGDLIELKAFWVQN